MNKLKCVNKKSNFLQYRRLIKTSLLFISLYSYSSISYAGNDAVTSVIENITKWLSGTPAVAIGVLAVIYSGYEMLQGEIDKRKLITRGIAIGLIIGGSFIGNSIIMQGL